MVFADVDVPDLLARQTGHVGDGADDVAGLDAMHIADFETERFGVLVGEPLAGLARSGQASSSGDGGSLARSFLCFTGRGRA